MLKTLIGKVFGTRHEREQRRVQPIVDEINGHYARLRDVPDVELQGQTARFRATLEERTATLKARIEELKAQKHAAADAAEREIHAPRGEKLKHERHRDKRHPLDS